MLQAITNAITSLITANYIMALVIVGLLTEVIKNAIFSIPFFHKYRNHKLVKRTLIPILAIAITFTLVKLHILTLTMAEMLYTSFISQVAYSPIKDYIIKKIRNV